MEKKSYVGNISNQGAQYVKAVVNPTGKNGKVTVKKGGDLRTK